MFKRKKQVATQPRRPTPLPPSVVNRRTAPKLTISECLQQAQGALAKLRRLNPGDLQAFPLLNEIQRLVQQLKEATASLPSADREAWSFQIGELVEEFKELADVIVSRADAAPQPEARLTSLGPSTSSVAPRRPTLSPLPSPSNSGHVQQAVALFSRQEGLPTGSQQSTALRRATAYPTVYQHQRPHQQQQYHGTHQYPQLQQGIEQAHPQAASSAISTPARSESSFMYLTDEERELLAQKQQVLLQKHFQYLAQQREAELQGTASQQAEPGSSATFQQQHHHEHQQHNRASVQAMYHAHQLHEQRIGQSESEYNSGRGIPHVGMAAPGPPLAWSTTGISSFTNSGGQVPTADRSDMAGSWVGSDGEGTVAAPPVTYVGQLQPWQLPVAQQGANMTQPPMPQQHQQKAVEEDLFSGLDIVATEEHQSLQRPSTSQQTQSSNEQIQQQPAAVSSPSAAAAAAAAATAETSVRVTAPVSVPTGQDNVWTPQRVPMYSIRPVGHSLPHCSSDGSQLDSRRVGAGLPQQADALSSWEGLQNTAEPTQSARPEASGAMQLAPPQHQELGAPGFLHELHGLVHPGAQLPDAGFSAAGALAPPSWRGGPLNRDASAQASPFFQAASVEPPPALSASEPGAATDSAYTSVPNPVDKKMSDIWVGYGGREERSSQEQQQAQLASARATQLLAGGHQAARGGSGAAAAVGASVANGESLQQHPPYQHEGNAAVASNAVAQQHQQLYTQQQDMQVLQHQQQDMQPPYAVIVGEAQKQPFNGHPAPDVHSFPYPHAAAQGSGAYPVQAPIRGPGVGSGTDHYPQVLAGKPGQLQYAQQGPQPSVVESSYPPQPAQYSPGQQLRPSLPLDLQQQQKQLHQHLEQQEQQKQAWQETRSLQAGVIVPATQAYTSVVATPEDQDRTQLLHQIAGAQLLPTNPSGGSYRRAEQSDDASGSAPDPGVSEYCRGRGVIVLDSASWPLNHTGASGVIGVGTDAGAVMASLNVETPALASDVSQPVPAAAAVVVPGRPSPYILSVLQRAHGAVDICSTAQPQSPVLPVATAPPSIAAPTSSMSDVNAVLTPVQAPAPLPQTGGCPTDTITPTRVPYHAAASTSTSSVPASSGGALKTRTRSLVSAGGGGGRGISSGGLPLPDPSAALPDPSSLPALPDLEAFLDRITGPVDTCRSAAEQRAREMVSGLATALAVAQKVEAAVQQQRRAVKAALAGVTASISQLEADQAAAVEGEDFDTAAALDEQLTQLSYRHANMDEQVRVLANGLQRAATLRLQVLGRQAEVWRITGAYLARLQVGQQQMAAALATQADREAQAASMLHRAAQEALMQRRSALEEGRAELQAAASQVVKRVVAATAPAEAELQRRASVRDALQAEVESLRALLVAKETSLAAAEDAVAEAAVVVRQQAALYDQDLAVLEEARRQLDAEESQVAGHEQALQDSERQAEARTTVVAEHQAQLRLQAEALETAVGAMAAESEALARRVSDQSRSEVQREQLQAADERAREELKALERCISDLSSDLSRLAEQRSRLAAERAAAQESLAALQRALPELEMAKRAAAASKEFREAARLSGELRALSAQADVAAAQLARVSGALTELTAMESSKVSELEELRALVHEAQRHAAEAHHRYLVFSLGLSQSALEEAVAVELYEEAGALQAEVAAEEAEVLTLERTWGFTRPAVTSPHATRRRMSLEVTAAGAFESQASSQAGLLHTELSQSQLQPRMFRQSISGVSAQSSIRSLTSQLPPAPVTEVVVAGTAVAGASAALGLKTLLGRSPMASSPSSRPLQQHHSPPLPPPQHQPVYTLLQLSDQQPAALSVPSGPWVKRGGSHVGSTGDDDDDGSRAFGWEAVGASKPPSASQVPIPPLLYLLPQHLEVQSPPLRGAAHSPLSSATGFLYGSGVAADPRVITTGASPLNNSALTAAAVKYSPSARTTLDGGNIPLVEHQRPPTEPQLPAASRSPTYAAEPPHYASSAGEAFTALKVAMPASRAMKGEAAAQSTSGLVDQLSALSGSSSSVSLLVMKECVADVREPPYNGGVEAVSDSREQASASAPSPMALLAAGSAPSIAHADAPAAGSSTPQPEPLQQGDEQRHNSDAPPPQQLRGREGLKCATAPAATTCEDSVSSGGSGDGVAAAVQSSAASAVVPSGAPPGSEGSDSGVRLEARTAPEHLGAGTVGGSSGIGRSAANDHEGHAAASRSNSEVL